MKNKLTLFLLLILCLGFIKTNAQGLNTADEGKKTKIGFIKVSDSSETEKAALNFFNRTYSETDVIDLTSSTSFDGYDVIWLHLDRTMDKGIDNLPESVKNNIEALKNFYDDGGKIYLSGLATQLVTSLNLCSEPTTYNSTTNDQQGNDVWYVNANYGAQHHKDVTDKIYAGLTDGIDPYKFPLINEILRDDHNCLWSGVNAGDFENQYNCKIIGSWGQDNNGESAGIVLFNPNANNGAVIVNGLAAYQWGKSDNKYESNIEQLTKNILNYLADNFLPPMSYEDILASTGKIAFIKSNNPTDEEQEVIKFFTQSYGAENVMSVSEVTSESFDGYNCVWIHLDRSDADGITYEKRLPDEFAETKFIQILKRFNKNGGSIYLSGQATQILVRTGRITMDFAPNAFGISNSIETIEGAWAVSPYNNHPIFNGLSGYNLIGTDNNTFKTRDHNAMWSLVELESGKDDFEFQNNARILGSWGQHNNYESAGIVEFLPYYRTGGTIIANGLAAYQWLTYNDETNIYKDNVKRLTVNTLYYLAAEGEKSPNLSNAPYNEIIEFDPSNLASTYKIALFIGYEDKEAANQGFADNPEGKAVFEYFQQTFGNDNILYIKDIESGRLNVENYDCVWIHYDRPLEQTDDTQYTGDHADELTAVLPDIYKESSSLFESLRTFHQNGGNIYLSKQACVFLPWIDDKFEIPTRRTYSASKTNNTDAWYANINHNNTQAYKEHPIFGNLTHVRNLGMWMLDIMSGDNIREDHTSVWTLDKIGNAKALATWGHNNGDAMNYAGMVEFRTVPDNIEEIREALSGTTNGETVINRKGTIICAGFGGMQWAPVGGNESIETLKQLTENILYYLSPVAGNGTMDMFQLVKFGDSKHSDYDTYYTFKAVTPDVYKVTVSNGEILNVVKENPDDEDFYANQANEWTNQALIVATYISNETQSELNFNGEVCDGANTLKNISGKFYGIAKVNTLEESSFTLSASDSELNKITTQFQLTIPSPAKSEVSYPLDNSTVIDEDKILINFYENEYGFSSEKPVLLDVKDRKIVKHDFSVNLGYFAPNVTEELWALAKNKGLFSLQILEDEKTEAHQITELGQRNASFINAHVGNIYSESDGSNQATRNLNLQQNDNEILIYDRWGNDPLTATVEFSLNSPSEVKFPEKPESSGYLWSYFTEATGETIDGEQAYKRTIILRNITVSQNENWIGDNSGSLSDGSTSDEMTGLIAVLPCTFNENGIVTFDENSNDGWKLYTLEDLKEGYVTIALSEKNYKASEIWGAPTVKPTDGYKFAVQNIYLFPDVNEGITFEPVVSEEQQEESYMLHKSAIQYLAEEDNYPSYHALETPLALVAVPINQGALSSVVDVLNGTTANLAKTEQNCITILEEGVSLYASDGRKIAYGIGQYDVKKGVYFAHKDNAVQKLIVK